MCFLNKQEKSSNEWGKMGRIRRSIPNLNKNKLWRSEYAFAHSVCTYTSAMCTTKEHIFCLNNFSYTLKRALGRQKERIFFFFQFGLLKRGGDSIALLKFRNYPHILGSQEKYRLCLSHFLTGSSVSPVKT